MPFESTVHICPFLSSGTALYSLDRRVIMRFGCTFHEHQLPGWTSQYLDYAALKKLAKQRSEQHGKMGNRVKFVWPTSG